MKNILTTLFILMTLSVSAQVKIGFTAGVNKTDGFDKNSDFLMINPRTSFNAGVGLDIKLIDRLSIEPLVLFSNKGWIFEDNFGDETENSLQYLSAQLLAKIHIIKNVKILAGPEFGYLLSVTGFDEAPDVSLFSDGDVGAVFGLEVSLFERISFHGKYTFGLNDVLDVNLTDENGNAVGTSAIKNRAIMVGATIYPFKVSVN